MLIRLGRQHASCPLAIGAHFDVLRLDGVFPTVKIHLVLANRDPWHAEQILGDRKSNGGIAWQASITGDNLANLLFCHRLLSFWLIASADLASARCPLTMQD